jgi:phosphohistidine phosphatase
MKLDDFDRPLNKRGKKDAPEMAGRLSSLAVRPDLIISSPAKRAKKTAIQIAKGTGYEKSAIRYYQDLYLGSMTLQLDLIETHLKKNTTLFLVGHNHTLTELAGFLSGKDLVNVPTCGIVALEYSGKNGFSSKAGAGKLLFFDYPKNRNSR